MHLTSSSIQRTMFALMLSFMFAETYCESHSRSVDLTIPQADFALELLHRSGVANSSTILSPISVSIALVMAYAGARGNTKAQISDVIAGGASYDDIINHFSWLMKQLSTPAAGYNLSSANRLFVADDFDILQSYRKLINDNFGGQLQQIDFARPAEAANEINDWVKNETNSRITEIVNEEILNGFVSMVLANALYFKAEWQHQFNPNSTINQIFFVNENEQREVEMMSINGRFLYAEDAAVQVIGLPYNNDEVFMYIFLPKEMYGLDDFLSTMTGEQLIGTLEFSMRIENVEVQIPKFKLEQQLQLNSALQQMGIYDAFVTRLANFSGISDKALYISDFVHKAFVEVAEEGTEAAAASAIILTRRARPQIQTPPVMFIANHPFMFAIVKDENVLFIGRLF